MIDPAFDGWVWGSAFLVLALLAVRAWLVETGQARLSRTTTRVRGVTAAVVVAMVVFTVLLGVQGGAQFVTDVYLAKTGQAVPGQPDINPAAYAAAEAKDAAAAAAAAAAAPAVPAAPAPAAPPPAPAVKP